ncbi:MAG: hypothetical protein ABMB14_39350, partial [Myxococcota bacterium]
GMGLPTGSPPIAAIGVTRGVGLRAMQERADEIGATLSVRAGPAGGTRVTVEFDPAAEEQA